MIHNSTIDAVLNINIVHVAEKYLNSAIKKAGANYITACPWHNDKHPSFTLSPAKGIATCFVCDKTVNNIGLLMETQNLSYPQAVKKLANDFNIKIVETGKKELTDKEKELYKELEAQRIVISWAADWYHNTLLALIQKYFPENNLYQYIFLDKNACFLSQEKEAVYYILQRFKGNIELIKHFKIGFAPSAYDVFLTAAKRSGFKRDVLLKAALIKKSEKNGREYFRDYFVFRPLIIPIYSPKGNITGFAARKMPWHTETDPSGKEYPKYINSPDTQLYKKSRMLFGFDFTTQKAIRSADKCYIVEGYTDKTSLFAIGIKNVIAKSGTALTDEQINELKKLTKNICLLDDGDNAGQLAMQKNGEKLTLAGCNVTVLTLPEKADPDSFFISKEHFQVFEKAQERDYITDIRADELNDTTTIPLKKKAKQAIAELLLSKNKEDREEYIAELSKKTETNKSEWNKAIRQAAISQRQKGLNIGEEEEEEIIPDNSQENRQKHNFYYIKKNKNGEPTGIELDERKILIKLKSTKNWEFEKNGKTINIYFGFYTYAINEDESEQIFVQLKNGSIKRVSVNYIKNTFFRYIRLLQPIEFSGYSNDGREWTKIVTAAELDRILTKKVTTIFEEKRLILFPDRKIKILKDTIDKHYTFFKNCYVISDKSGYKIYDYEDLKEGFVWDDQILDREFHKPKDNEPGIFEKFVHDISGNEWKQDENRSYMPEAIRYKSLLIAGGYLLHNYTDMQRKAVILTQGRISEDDTSEGREGKTLFVESLGRYMLNRNPDESKTYVYVPGKDLKNDDKHKWQDLELNTTCVLYDDPPPWINFEDLYNLAERAFKVEKKRKENMYIKARIFITTNRPLDRDSGSSKARSCVIELDSIYHADYTPTDKYGHYFFRDWKEDLQEEWNKFSDYVLGKMLPAYFSNNVQLLEPPSKNLYRNELLQKARRLTGNMEIVFWMDYLVKGDKDNEPYFKIGESYTTKELYDKLMNDRDYKDNKKLKRNFTKIIQAYFEKEGITVEKRRVASGTEFIIKSGLPEKIKINPQYLSDFFNNGHNIEELEEPGTLEIATKDFNIKYNMSITPDMLKNAVEELDQEMPF